MLIFKRWGKKGRYAKLVFWHGWFLFGIIPLIIRQDSTDA